MVRHSLLPEDPSQFIQKTAYEYDHNRIRQEIFEIVKPYNYLTTTPVKQLMLTCRKNSKDPSFEGIGKLKKGNDDDLRQSDFTEFNPYYKGTYLEEIWKSFPYPIGRMRIMLLQPHTCYSLHTDSEPRFHIAAKTNPQCYALYYGEPKWHQIPDDNGLYVFHTHHPHMYFNGGGSNRFHLVFDSLEEYVHTDAEHPARVEYP